MKTKHFKSPKWNLCIVFLRGDALEEDNVYEQENDDDMRKRKIGKIGNIYNERPILYRY